MNYDVDYFINKFKAIPEDYWCVYKHRIGKSRCAQGFCLENKDIDALLNMNAEDASAYAKNNIKRFAELKSAYALFKNILYIDNGYPTIANINNGDHPDYQQPTPKQRILAALYDIKKMQQKDAIEPAKPVIDLGFKEVTFAQIKQNINIPKGVN